MFATLPLEAFVCREVMETYFWPHDAFNLRRHVMITTALVAGALLGGSPASPPCPNQPLNPFHSLQSRS